MVCTYIKVLGTNDVPRAVWSQSRIKTTPVRAACVGLRGKYFHPSLAQYKIYIFSNKQRSFS